MNRKFGFQSGAKAMPLGERKKCQVCRGLSGTGLYERQLCTEGCGARPFLLATSQVSGTKENTRLFLKAFTDTEAG